MSTWNRIRARGIRYTFGGKFNQLVPAWLFRCRCFRVYRLAANDKYAEASGAMPLHFRWCESESDVRMAQALTFFHSQTDGDDSRFHACLAEQDGDPVGGVWQGIDHFDEEELGLRILMKPDQAWIFAAFVAKSHRGQGIYPRLLNHVLVEQDQRTHYASINTTNHASIAAHRHFFDSVSGRCIAIRFLSVTVCWAGHGLRVSRGLTTSVSKRPIEIALTF